MSKLVKTPRGEGRTSPREWEHARQRADELNRELEQSGEWWWRGDLPLSDGTWAVWNSLSMADDAIIARCSSEAVASYIVLHCPARLGRDGE